MSACEKLPAAELEWVLFRWVMVLHQPVQQISEAVGMLPSRVCEAVERVAGRLVQQAPGEMDEAEKARREHVAQWLAGKRLEHLMDLTQDSFLKSQGDQVTLRETEGDAGGVRKTRITKSSAGDPRLLTVLGRLIMMAAKLPVIALPLETQGDARKEAFPGSSEAGKGTGTPPEVGCSKESAEQAVSAPEQAAAPVANGCSNGSCESSGSPPKSAAPRATRPVQTAVASQLEGLLPLPTSGQEREGDPAKKKARREFFAAAG